MTDTVRFKKGATIIHEGTTGSNAYLILSGSVEVYKKVGDEKVVLSRLVKGNIFGEMSLVDDKPRSATIAALEDTEVRILSRERFESMLEQNPRAVIPLLKQVFQRVRYLNQMVTAFCGQASTGTVELATSSVFGSNDLDLEDTEPYRVSRCHCLITIVDNEYYVVDTVSSRGTLVDSSKIGGQEELKRVLLESGKHRITLGGEESPYVFDLEVP
jgi:CRP-like cAMP-binding protein